MRKEDFRYYFSEHRHNKRFISIFLMFVVIAVTLGFLFAFTIITSNSVKETKAQIELISGKAFFNLGNLFETEKEKSLGSGEINQVFYNCSRIDAFRLADLHDVFVLEATKEPNASTVRCQKAVYNRFPERVEVTYFGNRYDAVKQRDVAILEYKCFINNTLYNYQFNEISVDDIGFFAEVLKLKGYIAHGSSRVTLVMPERYNDFCLRD